MDKSPLKKTKSIYGEIFFFLISNAVAAAFGVITSIVLARILGPTQKGIVTAALLMPNLVIAIAGAGIKQSITFYVGQSKFSDNQIISAIVYLLLMVSVPGILACFFYFAFAFELSSDLTSLSICLLLSYIPFRLFTNYLNSFFIGKSRFRVVNLLKWGGSAVYLLFIIILSSIADDRKQIVFFSLLLLSITSFFFLFFLLFRFRYFTFSRTSLHFDRKIISQLVSLGFIFAIALFIVQLNLRADILFLNYFRNSETVGWYSVSVAFAEMIWQFPLAISVIIISKTAQSKDTLQTLGEVLTIFRITLFIVLISAVIIAFLAPLIIPFFYGQLFIPCIEMTQFILPGILFFSVMIILLSFFAGIGKPSYIIWAGLPALLLNCLLNFFLIPSLGGTGASIATDISYLFALLLSIFLLKRKFKVRIFDLAVLRKSDFALMLSLISKRKN